jgi:hypothetical protein
MSKPFNPRQNSDSSDFASKIFKWGARHYLHPKLSLLDQIDCVLEYYPHIKTMIVSYAPIIRKKDFTDYEEKIYSKTIISAGVDFIVETINHDYIQPIRHQMQETLIEEAQLSEESQLNGETE